MTRIGFGYDIHRFGIGRKLVLGGVKIPFKYGLIGHSDADVLLHSICDAMLGAAALGDIGKHFPDNQKKFKGISSIKLLGIVVNMLRKNHFRVFNVDSTVVLETPKLSKFIPQMQNKISKVLEVSIHDISIKATTNERLGTIGRNEGCAAFAVVTIGPTNERKTR